MDFLESFKNEIISLRATSFESAALSAFEYQFNTNVLYREYCQYQNRKPSNTRSLEAIPFLPIEFFKTKIVKSGNWNSSKYFLSSGTTGKERSKLPIEDLEFYHLVASSIFQKVFEGLGSYKIKSLLPSYFENGDSSLISMIDHLMDQNGDDSGHFHKKEDQLRAYISKSSDSKTVLFGVPFALLDFVGSSIIESSNLIIVETGGMKGRKKEITRSELLRILGTHFKDSNIYSEYGMTELTSQAYRKPSEGFQFPPWAKSLIREINDPKCFLEPGKIGGINVIDLANISTCCFIETKDLGTLLNENQFDILGRFDNSDIRGCNLLYN